MKALTSQTAVLGKHSQGCKAKPAEPVSIVMVGEVTHRR
jgi:hypothetical protein